MPATGNGLVKLSQLKRLKGAQDTSIALAVADMNWLTKSDADGRYVERNQTVVNFETKEV